MVNGNQFSKNAGTQPEAPQSPQPLEPLPPAEIPVNWDEAWLTGMKSGFKTERNEDAEDISASYSPLDQQKKKIEEEAWSRPKEWGDVDPDAWQDQLSRDGGVVDIPEDIEDAPLHEQLMFLAGQQRAKATTADAKEEESVKFDATKEEAAKVPLKIGDT